MGMASEKDNPREISLSRWYPWNLTQDVLNLLWKLSFRLAILICDILLRPPLRFTWIYVFPTSLKEYVRQLNWARISLKVLSRVLLLCYAWITIAMWYDSPWGPFALEATVCSERDTLHEL
jgi:hypothetical protein